MHPRATERRHQPPPQLGSGRATPKRTFQGSTRPHGVVGDPWSAAPVLLWDSEGVAELFPPGRQPQAEVVHAYDCLPSHQEAVRPARVVLRGAMHYGRRQHAVLLPAIVVRVEARAALQALEDELKAAGPLPGLFRQDVQLYVAGQLARRELQEAGLTSV